MANDRLLSASTHGSRMQTRMSLGPTSKSSVLNDGWRMLKWSRNGKHTSCRLVVLLHDLTLCVLPLLHHLWTRSDRLWLTPCACQFGQGSRTCIGKNISLMEMSKAVPQLIRNFDFVPATASGQPEWRTENVWFVKTRDFYCRVNRRA